MTVAQRVRDDLLPHARRTQRAARIVTSAPGANCRRAARRQAQLDASISARRFRRPRRGASRDSAPRAAPSWLLRSPAQYAARRVRASRLYRREFASTSQRPRSCATSRSPSCKPPPSGAPAAITRRESAAVAQAGAVGRRSPSKSARIAAAVPTTGDPLALHATGPTLLAAPSPTGASSGTQRRVPARGDFIRQHENGSSEATAGSRPASSRGPRAFLRPPRAARVEQSVPEPSTRSRRAPSSQPRCELAERIQRATVEIFGARTFEPQQLRRPVGRVEAAARARVRGALVELSGEPRDLVDRARVGPAVHGRRRMARLVHADEAVPEARDGDRADFDVERGDLRVRRVDGALGVGEPGDSSAPPSQPCGSRGQPAPTCLRPRGPARRRARRARSTIPRRPRTPPASRLRAPGRTTPPRRHSQPLSPSRAPS